MPGNGDGYISKAGSMECNISGIGKRKLSKSVVISLELLREHSRRFFSEASRPLNQLFIARLRSAPKQQFMISGILLPIARNASRWV
jgi:hypothetical protein